MMAYCGDSRCYADTLRRLMIAQTDAVAMDDVCCADCCGVVRHTIATIAALIHSTGL